MKNTDKIKNFFLLLLFTITCLSAPVLAHSQAMSGAEAGSIFKQDQQDKIKSRTKLSASGYDQNRDLEDVIANIIRIILGVLGVIFVVLMFLTGNDWLQAAGNEEKIKTAKKRIQTLLVGLIFILIAYAVSSGFSGALVKVLIIR